MMKIGIGNLEMTIGNALRTISPEEVKNLEKFLNTRWGPTIEKIMENKDKDEVWGGYKKFGKFLIGRIDMTPDNFGEDNNVEKRIYEIEKRPAGFGIFFHYLKTILKRTKEIEIFREVINNFECRGFININTSIPDDRFAAEIFGLPYYQNYQELPNSGFYWVRSNNRTGEICKLEPYSLSPIRLDGDKQDLVELNLAKRLNLQEINWKEPFVIKPLIGTRGENVEIYIPPHLQKQIGFRGSTATRIHRKISGTKESYIIQKFIPPLIEEINGRKECIILRLFFVWREREYQILGGWWNRRPSIKVHGASDAVFSPCIISDDEESFFKE